MPLASRPHRRFSRAAFALIVFFIELAKVKAAVEIVSPVENQIIRYRNESLLFNCTVTPAGRVNKTISFQWMRNDDFYKPPGKTDTPYWSSFELKNGLQSGDEGVYKCISDVGSKSVEVHLAEKPKVHPVGKSSPIFARLDDLTQLKCKATGWPKPNITWFRNGRNVRDINQGGFYDFPPVAPGQSELDILFTQWEHEGLYICMAWNAVGEDNATIQVQIDPDYTWSAEKTKYTAIVGTDANLICVGQGVIFNSNYTLLSWVFNGTEIKITGDHYLVRNDYYLGSEGKFRTQLSIRNVMYADSGNYSCRIVTLYGRTTNHDNIVLEVKAEDNNNKNKDNNKEKRLKTWMIAVISAVHAILTLLLITFIIVVCFRRRRRKKKLLAIAQKYDQEEQVFEHDLFISYSTKDYDWVQQSLLPVLDENNIDYIIHSRDFVPGKAWLDNMADSVYNSKKVILIMSSNYLSSAFCRDEMQMAIHRCSERDDSSLIVVRIDNIKSNDIPKSLRHRTFIDVTSKEETTTWQRRILDYVLSVVSSGSVISDESFNDTDTKSLLSMFKLKRKKKRNNAERELENQAMA